MKQWYVVHTHVHAEAQTSFNLKRQGYGVYLPSYLKRRRHARRTDYVRSPLFPRYLFVEFDPGEQQWRAIRSTVGVSYLICNGETPLSVPDAIIEDIRSRENADGLVALSAPAGFSRGDRVQIVGGALCDQVGLFDCVSDDKRVQILIDLLGRPVKVRVPFEFVSAVA